MQNPLNIGHMYVILMNIGLSPQHGLCQLFRPHPTSRNSYSSDKYNNSTAAILTQCWGDNQTTNDVQYDARDKFPSRVVGGGMAGESVAT